MGDYKQERAKVIEKIFEELARQGADSLSIDFSGGNDEDGPDDMGGRVVSMGGPYRLMGLRPVVITVLKDGASTHVEYTDPLDDLASEFFDVSWDIMKTGDGDGNMYYGTFLFTNNELDGRKVTLEGEYPTTTEYGPIEV